jgi:hypothetical protein
MQCSQIIEMKMANRLRVSMKFENEEYLFMDNE